MNYHLKDLDTTFDTRLRTVTASIPRFFPIKTRRTGSWAGLVWLCEVIRGFGDIMRQIDCRVHYHYNGGHPRRRLCLTQLIDGRNFGRKREKAGNYRSDEKRKGEKKGTGKRERERERGHTNGLISQQCDLFALYSHKEPTLLCHYVTKEGVIAQQGPPVRLLYRQPV